MSVLTVADRRAATCGKCSSYPRRLPPATGARGRSAFDTLAWR